MRILKINNEKLEVAMARSCMTLGKLSEQAKLNYSTLTRIKTGKHTQPFTVGKIAKALNVPVESLIETETDN